MYLIYSDKDFVIKSLTTNQETPIKIASLLQIKGNSIQEYLRKQQN